MFFRCFLIISVMAWNLYDYDHEFHVTLTSMEYSPVDSTYQISIKIFSDDLEKGLKGLTFQDESKSKQTPVRLSNKSIEPYILKLFKLFDHNLNEVPLNYIGSETEMDVTWVYLESEKIIHVNRLKVENKILNEIYKDQSHIVNFHLNEETSTVLLNQSKPISEL